MYIRIITYMYVVERKAMRASIMNYYKQTTRVAANLLKNGGNLLISTRHATTIADYKITWVRPDKPSVLSPDNCDHHGLKIDVKSSDFGRFYNDLPELKNANDIVKKMFTLQFLPRKESVILRRDKICELVKRHRLDRKSPEAQIAIMTSDIHQLQQHFKELPSNKRVKVKLLNTISQRKKLLKLLREWDYRRFEWILEKLDLVYKPPPELPHHVTRKESLKRLTEKHCDKLVQEKLDTYKSELKELQKDFYVEKARKLAFIREEELACGLKPSVSKEDIAYAEQKARELEA